MSLDWDALIRLASSQFWQVTAVILLVGLLVQLFCRRRPHLAYVLWLLVVLKCLAPPVWSSPTGVFSWAGAEVSRPAPAADGADEETAPVPHDAARPVVAPAPVVVPAPSFAPAEPPAPAVKPPPADRKARTEASDAARMQPAEPAPPARQVSAGSVVAIVWFCGALVLGGVLVARRVACAVLLWRAHVPTEERVARRVAELSRRMGIRRKVRVLVTTRTFGPAVCGLLRPRLVLPRVLIAECTAEGLERILAHELIHVRRGDNALGALQLLAQVVWWFHPLVWWANLRMCREREICCDEEVVATLSCDPGRYAQSLLDVLKLRRQLRPAFLFSGVRAGEVTTKRLEKIMDNQRAFHRRMPWVCWAVLGAGILLVLPGAGLTLTEGTPEAKPDVAEAGAPQQAREGNLLNDGKLNEAQRLIRDWSEKRFGSLLNPPGLQELAEQEKAAREKEWLEQLSPDQGRANIPAINGLAAIRSEKAVSALLKIAADPREKDNADRWMAVRALGLIGDDSAVPQLVHLTYHYNLNTRFWAEISLVRLTGENFGRDLGAWRRWWKAQGKQPPIPTATVTWTNNSEWADPEKQAEMDRGFIEKLKGGAEASAATQSAVPRIVATSPAIGATDVDPSTAEITVTFDRDMEGGFSWTGGGPQYPPIPEGKKVAWRDRRTCVLPVDLQPGTYYRVGINSTSYQNFRSAQGVPARPAAIYFTTRGAGEELKNKVQQPQIVSMNPPNGATDVDPGIKELRVTFNVPMGGGFSWTGGGPQFPKVAEGKRPHWTEDHKTCVLPVELKPAQSYRLGFNSPSHKNFQSAAGVPLEPVVYTFTTSSN